MKTNVYDPSYFECSMMAFGGEGKKRERKGMLLMVYSFFQEANRAWQSTKITITTVGIFYDVLYVFLVS